MNVELRTINKDNREKCMTLKVVEEQAQYICSNRDSLNDAAENNIIARPFAIYIDGLIAGFTMFAFDEAYEDPNDRYWLSNIDMQYLGLMYYKMAPGYFNPD